MQQLKNNILRAEKRILPFETRRSLPLAVVCYPNTYSVGMSNLAFQFLLQSFNRPSLRLERAFALPQAWKGVARTFESGETISGARVILATISYEDDALHLIALLRAAGIPLRSTERGVRDPLVIVGGNGVSANPMIAAPVCDAIALGEFGCDDPLPGIVERYAGGRMSRSECLETLSSQANIFVPSIRNDGRDVPVLACSRMKTKYEPVASTIVSPYSHFPDTLLIEINRSCVSSCRFCLASYLSKPFRIARREAILEICEQWKGRAKAVGLIGTAVTSYPGFESLCSDIQSMGFSIKMSSLRIEGLKRETLELIASLGIRTITFAPETANERLRRCIGKDVSDAEIDQTLALVDRLPIGKIKFYYMYGLPGEADADLLQMVDAVKAMRKHHNNIRIEHSINCLVPKASTPLQWFPLPRQEEIDRKRALIIAAAKSRLRETPVLTSSAGVLFQAALSVGGIEIGESLMRGERSKGAMIRRWRAEHTHFDRLLHDEKAREHQFPWDRIGTGTSKDSLYREYAELMACVNAIDRR